MLFRSNQKRKIRIGTLSRVKYTYPVPREEYVALCLQQARDAGERGCDVFVLPEHFDSFGASEMEVRDGGVYDEATDRSALYLSLIHI